MPQPGRALGRRDPMDQRADAATIFCDAGPFPGATAAISDSIGSRPKAAWHHCRRHRVMVLRRVLRVGLSIGQSSILTNDGLKFLCKCLGCLT